MPVKKFKCYNAWRRLINRYGEALPLDWQGDFKALIADIGQPEDDTDFVWVREEEGEIRKENVRWARQSERSLLNKLREEPDRKPTKFAVYKGERYTYRALAELFGLPVALIHYRIGKGQPEKDWNKPIDPSKLPGGYSKKPRIKK